MSEMCDIQLLKYSLNEWKQEIYTPSDTLVYARHRLDSLKMIILARLTILEELNDLCKNMKVARNSMEDSIYAMYDLLFGEEIPSSSIEECYRIMDHNMDNIWKQYKEIKRINSGYTSSTSVGASMIPPCDYEMESFEEEI